jgi:hypothetical protein
MAMNHDYIQEHQVIDRYVMGRLSEAEADRFEDHYLTCNECVRQLDLAQQFQVGFRQVAAEEATGLLAILTAVLRSRRGLVLGSALAVALGLALFALLSVRTARLGRDLEAARAQLAQTEERGAEEARRAAAAGRELESLRARLKEEQARLAGALSGEKAARDRLAKESGRARLPQAAGVWLVTLVPARSGPAAGEPFQRITLAPKTQWVVLQLDLDLSGPDPYRVTLQRRDGTTVWSESGLRPGPAGTLAVGVEPSLLVPGDYRLLVESQPSSGRPFPVSRFSFRVVAR